MTIDFSNVSIQKDATIKCDDITYNINVMSVNNDITKLYCEIYKEVDTQQPDENGGMQSIKMDAPIGHITMEYGRIISEINQDEDVVYHLAKFKEISNEVTGEEVDVDTEILKE